MNFIELVHPEGGTILLNVDHITAAHFRRGEGDVKTRLGLDIHERQSEIILFGEEAERTWQKLQALSKTST